MDYSKIEAGLKTKDGEPFYIPLEGSLSLLALGDMGLILWRNKRAQFVQNKIRNKDEE